MTETPRELDPLVEGFIKFGVSLYHGSRFFSRPTQEIAEALREVIGPLKSKLGPEDHEFFFRARLHDSPRMKEPTGPFQGNDIMNPPGDRALAGRLNCAGISRLYLSSTEDTAAAEVRAITGDFVTIAKLRLREPITAIDFRKTKEAAGDDFNELLAYITRIISVPVFGHDNYECVLSQWITEYMQFFFRVDAVIWA